MYDRYSLEEGKMKTSFRDWRQALRTPATYRVGNAVRIQPQFVVLITLAGSFLLILFYNMSAYADTTAVSNKPVWLSGDRQYNAVYPLTNPVIHKGVYTYKIAIVADLDKKSRSTKKPDSYMSYVRTGFLSYSEQDEIVKIQWDLVDTTIPIFSSYSQNGRGMELSELITYNSKILTFDDRSGLVFEMAQHNLIPWVVLADGNGQTAKGFKSEWATIKDGLLYVGSIGKEWTSSNGSFENDNPMWIKVVNAKGEVHHLNWSKEYKALRKSIGIEWPGYMIHESAAWSPIHNKWYFLPRRCSHNVYDEAKDEVMGCNYLITADEGFKNIDAIEITKRKPKFGFSSFKFVPRTNEEVIVALKTTEFEEHTATYITVIKSNGKELLSDQFIDDIKYEGIEFI